MTRSTPSHTRLQIDHLMWVVPDLDAGIADLTTRLGVRARKGGSHLGRGTRNALVSFANGQYLEILAPDPAQKLPGTRGAELAKLPAGRLETFCCRGQPLKEIAAEARIAGLEAHGPLDFKRRRPDGLLLEWQLLFLAGHRFGRLLPFFIDWQDAPHPSADEPARITLESFVALAPDADALHRLYHHLDIHVPVEQAEEPGFRVVLDCAGRQVQL